MFLTSVNRAEPSEANKNTTKTVKMCESEAIKIIINAP